MPPTAGSHSSSFSVEQRRPPKSPPGSIPNVKRKLIIILSVFVVALGILLALLLQHLYRGIEGDSSKVFYYAAAGAFQRFQDSLQRVLRSKDIPELMYLMEIAHTEGKDEPAMDESSFELDSTSGTVAYAWLTEDAGSSLRLPGLYGVPEEQWTDAEKATLQHLQSLLQEKHTEITLPCMRENLLSSAPGESQPVNLELSHEYSMVVYPSPCSVVSGTYSNQQHSSAGNFAMVFHTDQFLLGSIRESFSGDSIFDNLMLSVLHQGKVKFRFDGKDQEVVRDLSEYSGVLVYQGKLSNPFEQYSLLFSIASLPESSGFGAVMQVTVALALVVLWGVVVIYQLASGYLELARQRSDFVSVVSSSLRTPLTAIRMLSEILEQGWIEDNDKKKRYYWLIRNEAQRLSRLMTNLLRTQSPPQPVLETISGTALLEFIRWSVEETTSSYGFELVICSKPEDLAAEIEVTLDRDGLRQILLNLVDDAVDYGAEAKTKKIEITLSAPILEGIGEVLAVAVRDYIPRRESPSSQVSASFLTGPLIPPDHTRLRIELAGTLADRMGAQLEAVEHEQGTEFRILFIPHAA